MTITNRDLIQHLLNFPLDANVVIRMMSECDDLDLEDITFIQAKDKKLIRRNGKYITVRPEWLDPNEPEPEYVTVIHFPGN